ncbi:hypothetical protein [Paraburkholderia sp. J7]|uniref:hypothetical protein n=1 Tax=Paraburkholderia sp. J7 TaxID=2805438 RepID=UPI002AB6B209|nr:hypothetical protein [Paraburkholderia sp. J7]
MSRVKFAPFDRDWFAGEFAEDLGPRHVSQVSADMLGAITAPTGKTHYRPAQPDAQKGKPAPSKPAVSPTERKAERPKKKHARPG